MKFPRVVMINFVWRPIAAEGTRGFQQMPLAASAAPIQEYIFKNRCYPLLMHVQRKREHGT